ncbi:MAG: SRPBCC domain-containing protein [Proteobacteria bacterium]|nr:SRPBCC domain-containing protein [Pseudomonadota bacterium]
MTDAATDIRTITVEQDFPHPPAKLWRALTQPHLIEEWLMKNDFLPEVGHRFKLRGDWGGVLDCKVLTIEPLRTLSYTWDHAHEDPAFNLRSVVTFTLTPSPTGTLLRVEQSGFRPDQKQALGGAQAGWKKFLEKLEPVAARV